MDLTLAAVADQFRARARRGATPEAQAEESRELTKFVAALGAGTRLAQITPGQIEDYQGRFIPRSRADEDPAKALRTNRLAIEHLRVVQLFLRWAFAQNLTTLDLSKALKLPAKSARPVENGIP